MAAGPQTPAIFSPSTQLPAFERTEYKIDDRLESRNLFLSDPLVTPPMEHSGRAVLHLTNLVTSDGRAGLDSSGCVTATPTVAMGELTFHVLGAGPACDGHTQERTNALLAAVLPVGGWEADRLPPQMIARIQVGNRLHQNKRLTVPDIWRRFRIQSQIFIAYLAWRAA